MEPLVVVVLLTRNRLKDLSECIDSLLKGTYSNTQLLVVDNVSTDGTVDAIKARYPGVTVIANSENLGYAEGNNVGMRWALEHGADYVLVLNDDTIVGESCIARLVEVAEQAPKAAFVGPLVYHADEPRVIQSAGGAMTWTWRAYHIGRNELDAGQYHQTTPVVWLSGCAILARSSALPAIGLLDPDFFIYSEDVDWCLRARRAGYEVLLAPQAKLWHKGVQRVYVPSPRITYLSVRNEFYLLAKHRAGPLALAATWLRHLRTLISWSVRPRWRDRRRHRDALAQALRDFMLGRVGPPPI